MIHIYYMNLSSDCSYEQSLILYGILPPERQEKVKAAKREKVARKRLYTGAFLQYVISLETGIPMKHITYTYGVRGKPELDCHNLEKLLKCETTNIEEKFSHGFYFNLSHSGDYAVLAVSDGRIGIDIEYKKNNYEAVAKRCFCKEEYADIMSAETVVEQQQRFLQYWTMKEAYIKYTGEGLGISLASFRIIRQEKGLSNAGDRRQWFASMRLDGMRPYYVALCSSQKKDLAEMNEKELTDVWTEVNVGNIYY